MQHNVNGFRVCWAGATIVQATRTTEPIHGYEFETFPGRTRLKRAVCYLPVDVPVGDLVKDAERFVYEARTAVERFLQSESVM